MLFFISIALSEKECELWLRGLENLIVDTISSPFPLQVERWLRKEFYNMEPIREVLVKILINFHLYHVVIIELGNIRLAYL